MPPEGTAETLLDVMGMHAAPVCWHILSCSPPSSSPAAGPPRPPAVRNRCLLVSASLLMLALTALQSLGVSEEAVLQLTPNRNPFIAQGSLPELTAGQGEPSPILAAGAAKLQPSHVSRLPHRYPLGRGGHVEVSLNCQAGSKMLRSTGVACTLNEGVARLKWI